MSETHEMTSSEIEQAVESLVEGEKISMTATQIPQRSDRAGENFDKDASHWKIQFSREGSGYTMDLEFSQGSAHRVWKKSAPHAWLIMTRYGQYAEMRSKPVAGHRVPMMYGRVRDTVRKLVENHSEAIAPDITSVLHCLCLDMDCLDYPFEEWAANIGGDTDSIKCRDMWQACVDQSIKTRSFFGEQLLEKIAALVNEY